MTPEFFLPSSGRLAAKKPVPTGSAVGTASRAMVVAFANTATAVLLVAGVYLVKSAAGINLLPGPSPLHDLLYHLVR